MPRRLFAVIRTIFWASLFVSLWTYFLPRWIGGPRVFDRVVPGGLIVITIGVMICFSCFFVFALIGLGTPAPWDAPRKLVVRGIYRYVRNPMYLGMLIVMIGEAITFPNTAHTIAMLLPIFLVAVSLFVVFYEEPALREKFGGEYDDYTRRVPRWIPRFR